MLLPNRSNPLLFPHAPHFCLCVCNRSEAQRKEVRTLLLNRSKILLAPASSAYKHSIK